MFIGSRFCARCGAEAARTRVEDGESLECPRCAEEMPALDLGGTHVHECAACGGLWLDPESLQKLCDAREAHADVVSALAARVPTAAAPPDTVRYIPCPNCRKLMNRVNFAKSSGVVIDVCKNHGAWLDRGELQRVVGFVEGGGLAAARDREKERLVDEQRRLSAMQQQEVATYGTPRITVTRTTWTGGGGRRDGNTAIDQLLSDAVGLFFK
jgi:Zn-finger nucleic acid-binding protein